MKTLIVLLICILISCSSDIVYDDTTSPATTLWMIRDANLKNTRYVSDTLNSTTTTSGTYRISEEKLFTNNTNSDNERTRDTIELNSSDILYLGMLLENNPRLIDFLIRGDTSTTNFDFIDSTRIYLYHFDDVRYQIHRDFSFDLPKFMPVTISNETVLVFNSINDTTIDISFSQFYFKKDGNYGYFSSRPMDLKDYEEQKFEMRLIFVDSLIFME